MTDPNKMYRISYTHDNGLCKFTVYETLRGLHIIGAGFAESEDFKIEHELTFGDKYHCEECTTTVLHPHNCREELPPPMTALEHTMSWDQFERDRSNY